MSNKNDEKDNEEFVNIKFPKNLINKFSKIFKLEGERKGNEINNFFSPLNDFMNEMVNKTMKALFNKDNRKDLASIFDNFKDQIGKIAYNVGIIDRDLHDLFKSIVDEAFNIDEDAANEVLESYRESISNKEPIETVTQSVSIKKDLFSKLNPLTEENSLIKILPEIHKIFGIVIKNDNEIDFREKIYDLILKFGGFVEGYIKEILIAYLKLCSICKNDNLKEYTKIKNLQKSQPFKMGFLINELNRYKAFNLEPRLDKLRNSIFHFSFKINYEVDPNDRTIKFKYTQGKKELEKVLSIDEFIDLYNYQFTIWRTFNSTLIKYIDFPFEEYLNKLSKDISDLQNPEGLKTDK